MTAQQATLQAADRQALFVVQSIHDVAKSVDRRRDQYRHSSDEDERRILRNHIMGDLERLSNLVTLLESIPEHELHPSTFKALQDCLGHLRGRVSAIGANMTLDKIRELRSQAEFSANRREHPVGKSFLLKESFLRYVEQLRSLVSGLTPENAEDLMTSAISINNLIENDLQRSPLDSFFNDPPLTPIDLSKLTFPPLADDLPHNALF